jgi:trehalose 6-phosphate phosphatase
VRTEGERVGLFTDLDGTLSPITPTPGEAAVDARCRVALGALVGRLTLVAVVSGRAAEDARRLVDLAGVVYVGNHGLEIWRDGALRISPEVTTYPALLDGLLGRLRHRLADGALLYEPKGPTASVHYRAHPDPARARRSILDAIAADELAGRVRVTEGRRVVEIRPPVVRDKGVAVAELARTEHLTAVIYLGDDRTDMDAFLALGALCRHGELTTAVRVAVASPETPTELIAAADVTVEGIPGVAAFLESVAA